MTKWVESTPAVDARLTDTQINTWQEQGFALAHDLLPETLLRKAAEDTLAACPAPGSEAAATIDNFGSNQHFVFPSSSEACNQITLHPALLRAVADLLGTDIGSLRLTQSDVWPKYGRAPSAHNYDNADQRIHCDYPNHMLTHPPGWYEPDAVEIIIYLSEFESCAGSTAVVPRQGPDDPAYEWPITRTPGVGALPYINDRTRAEAYLSEHAPDTATFREEHLYARECLARYQFGSVLLYRHDTWHRGTPVKTGALRVVHNLTFRKADNTQVNTLHPGWSWAMYHPNQFMEKLVAQATVDQRGVLGFPMPGDAYWTAQTIAAATARYGVFGMDMAPYEARLN